MSTDKPCYHLGEPVSVTATGHADVPAVGDFPDIFWAVANASGGTVWATTNQHDAIGHFNGTWHGTWNQSQRSIDPSSSQPIYGGPVPPDDYVIWFYTVPGPNFYPDTWHPANITIGTCSQKAVADAGGPYSSAEDEPVRFDGTASRSSEGTTGIASYQWDADTRVDSDGDGNATNDGDVTGPTPTWTYGDDGPYTITLKITDAAGLVAWDTAQVMVSNAAPTLLDLRAEVAATVILRVAGEKWHDVQVDLVWNNAVTESAHVVRTPGSPDRQMATLSGANIELLGDFRIVLHYTPADDPVNGQANGATPAWVILRFADGTTAQLHHTFNVRHPGTWTWTIADFAPFLVGKSIAFDATAHDVGSDDLTFSWDFGDGATTATTYFNDGVSPDPHPSPEVNPITANDVHGHAFALAGTYTVTLTVTDDDGGSVARTLLIHLGA